MTTTTTTPDQADPLAELKAAQQRTWGSGDYGRIAWLTVPIADALCTAVDLRAGARVLDVATGTGHVALAAARRFCDASGIDYVPSLVDVARRRAEAEGLEVDLREGDAEALPFASASFDYVLSAIGVMFTADHTRAARELVRVCRPGGRIGLACWTPTGFVGEMLRTVARHVPPPPAAQPPTRWGHEATVRELLGDEVTDVRYEPTAVRQVFRSPEQFAEHFLTYYGPTHRAASALPPEGRAALRSDLAALAAARNRADDGTVATDWEYALISATRAA
jgi:SAM-dependent methyltransferase